MADQPQSLFDMKQAEATRLEVLLEQASEASFGIKIGQYSRMVEYLAILDEICTILMPKMSDDERDMFAVRMHGGTFRDETYLGLRAKINSWLVNHQEMTVYPHELINTLDELRNDFMLLRESFNMGWTTRTEDKTIK